MGGDDDDEVATATVFDFDVHFDSDFDFDVDFKMDFNGDFDVDNDADADADARRDLDRGVTSIPSTGDPSVVVVATTISFVAALLLVLPRLYNGAFFRFPCFDNAVVAVVVVLLLFILR